MKKAITRIFIPALAVTLLIVGSDKVCSAPADISLNSGFHNPGDQLTATFQLSKTITKRFTAYAVVILPDGSMVNAIGFDTPLRPVVTNIRGLSAPFSCNLIDTLLPGSWGAGHYEVLAAFFNPKKRITGRGSAFMSASGPFDIGGSVSPEPNPTATPYPTAAPSIPDISGPWSGTWEVGDPDECNGEGGEWVVTFNMASDGTLSGDFSATGGEPDVPDVSGAVSGSFDGTTATWTVSTSDYGSVSYSGTITESGTIISGAFGDGPGCQEDGDPVSGGFDGGKD